jgi:hypothetical protein
MLQIGDILPDQVTVTLIMELREIIRHSGFPVENPRAKSVHSDNIYNSSGSTQ